MANPKYGYLGGATGGTASSPAVTIYTVPSNMSHAVVTVTLCGMKSQWPSLPGVSGNGQYASKILLQNQMVLGLRAASNMNGTQAFSSSNSVSLIMKTNETLKFAVGNNKSEAVVYGYEVPN